MVKIKFELPDGLKIGETIYKEGELKELTIGDVLEAETEAEELRYIGNDEVRLVRSPAKLGLGLLRRQVASLGTLEMPLTDESFQALSRKDLKALQNAADKLDAASYAKVVKRGRNNEGTSELLPASE